MLATRQISVPVFILLMLFLLSGPTGAAVDTEKPSPADQRLKAMEFHLRAQQKAGLLIPMYIYPANIHTNKDYNRLMGLKRKYETIPFWVVLNPASGPGTQVDANYTKAVDRLQGAGCVVLGYVTTGYGKRPSREVAQDLAQWRNLYPRVQGVFFDEMAYEDKPELVEYQLVLKKEAQKVGFWPLVANPGAETPGRYFSAEVADVIIVHEGNDWPQEDRLKGDYFGGYSDYPPFTRGILVHSKGEFDPSSLHMVRQYSRWIYITDDLYKPGHPTDENPWDTLSQHLESLCQELELGSTKN